MYWPFYDPFDLFGVPTLQSDEQPDKPRDPIKFVPVTKPRRIPHLFGATEIILAHEAEDGLERHERECPVCHLFRITVIAPRWGKIPPAWREYRHGIEGTPFVEDIEPSCPGVSVEDKGRAA